MRLLVAIMLVGCGSKKEAPPAAVVDSTDPPAVDCTKDIAAADIKELVVVPHKAANIGLSGCEFVTPSTAGVRIILNRIDPDMPVQNQMTAGMTGNQPLAGFGDQAFFITAPENQVSVRSGKLRCLADLTGTKDHPADLGTGDVIKQMAAICVKLMAKKTPS